MPCRAGQLSAVVYANGDVGLCEIHEPVGNLRENTFPEIWASAQAETLRKSIAAKECFCTTEVFMWSSILHQPVQLVRAIGASKAWKKAVPLPDRERIPVELGPDKLPLSANGTNGTSAANGAAVAPESDAEVAAEDAPAERLVQLEPSTE